MRVSRECSHLWKCKKQQIVSKSSLKLIIVLCYHLVVIWFHGLLHDFGIPLSSPTPLYDNLSASRLASNPVYHEPTKYMEVDLHFI